MSTLYMFSGSSAVGKTTTLNAVRHKVAVNELTARTVREQFGTPSWVDIMKDRNLANSIQMAQLRYFIQRVQEIARNNLNVLDKLRGQDIVVERSPWDVLGYSVAFNCSADVIAQQEKLLAQFEDWLIDLDVNVKLVPFVIDPAIPYVQIPERPPENIRDACHKKLQLIWRTTLIDKITPTGFMNSAR